MVYALKLLQAVDEYSIANYFSPRLDTGSYKRKE